MRHQGGGRKRQARPPAAELSGSEPTSRPATPAVGVGVAYGGDDARGGAPTSGIAEEVEIAGCIKMGAE
jgi:hypothetical protein